MLVTFVVGIVPQSPSDGAPKTGSQLFVQSQTNEQAVLSYVQSALANTGNVGRVYFRANCPLGSDGPLVFPMVHVLRPPRKLTGIEQVRAIFRKAKDVSIVEETGGVVRISIGEVSQSVLQTSITMLEFSEVSQYTPLYAIHAIENANEIRLAMRNNGFHFSGKPTIAGVNPPLSDMPHLPVKMLHVTMDEALDEVARTFRTVVMYGACKNSGLVEIRESISDKIP